MKKLAILCALVGAVGLAGCGGGEETTAQTTSGYGTVAGDSIPTVNLTQPAPKANDPQSEVSEDEIDTLNRKEWEAARGIKNQQ